MSRIGVTFTKPLPGGVWLYGYSVVIKNDPTKYELEDTPIGIAETKDEAKDKSFKLVGLKLPLTEEDIRYSRSDEPRRQFHNRTKGG